MWVTYVKERIYSQVNNISVMLGNPHAAERDDMLSQDNFFKFFNSVKIPFLTKTLDFVAMATVYSWEYSRYAFRCQNQ